MAQMWQFSVRVVSLHPGINCYHVVSIPLCWNLRTRQHLGRIFHAISSLEAELNAWNAVTHPPVERRPCFLLSRGCD